MHTHWPRGIAVPAAVLLALAGCGGGGSSGVTPAPEPTPLVTPSPAPGPASAPAPAPVAQASAQVCSAQNPYRADATAPTQTGSLQTEKAWVRAYVDAAYLWYNEVPSVNADLPEYSKDTASGFLPSIEDYFSALKVDSKDRFSFTYSTKALESLFQGGVSVSHGITFHLGSTSPPRQIRVADVEPGSAAAAAGLLRGDTLVSVDDASADDSTAAGITKLNAGWIGSDGVPHRFVFSRGGAQLPVITLTGKALTSNPVPETSTFTRGSAVVGYIRFNDHNAPSEAKLVTSITRLRDAKASELVLDLRYNGGGFLYIASQLGYMIAGPQRTAGKTFMKLKYNAKRAEDNAQAPTPFLSQTLTDETLPTLNLSRVFVLTTHGTCSASEAIINGLEGVGVQVVRIGTQTCGKPYGYSGKDNCGISYFPIEFSGVNDKGYGDYANGFEPTCKVADDLDHKLGDPAEAQLATALSFRDTGACPAASSRAVPAQLKAEPVGLVRHPVRTNAFLMGGQR